MKNIQLLQRFVSDKLFDKIHRVPLGHLVTFADLDVKLTDDEKDEITRAVALISEYREKEQNIPKEQYKF